MFIYAFISLELFKEELSLLISVYLKVAWK